MTEEGGAVKGSVKARVPALGLLLPPSLTQKPSEKPRASLRCLRDYRNGTFRPIFAFVYRPNLRSKRSSSTRVAW